jgi:hypothetical protein
MSHESESMYEKQAQIITDLRKQIQAQQTEIDRIEALATSGQYYNAMMEMIEENPTLQEEWVGFIATMRLCVPDMQERFKITHSPRYMYQRWM